MADEPTEDPPAKGDPPEPKKPDEPEMGDAGKKALDAERKARRDAEKALKDVQGKLAELEDKDKSETEKLREQVQTLTKERDDANLKVLRLEIAAEKGVKPRWLNGSTREELEAAADEYLEDHPPATGAQPPPSGKPKPDLKGGGDPTTEAVDVNALIDSIPPTA